jgi:hypothetical protein
VGGLDDRARRLEEQPEWREMGDRLEKGRALREAIGRLSTPELRATKGYMDDTGREEWAEEDTPLMLRLLELMEEVRREEAEVRGQVGEPPWLSETKREERRDDGHREASGAAGGDDRWGR